MADHATICALQVTTANFDFGTTVVTADALIAVQDVLGAWWWIPAPTTCDTTATATIQVEWMYHVTTTTAPQATATTFTASTPLPGATSCCFGFQCNWNVPATPAAPGALPQASFSYSGTTLQATINPQLSASYCTPVLLDVDLYTPGTFPY